ncbi:MAG: hypothetical protein H7Z43_14895 [Clostridia bacterium]|nr:hypothetical protein [Deltaproteobacteria bacterium]
MTQTLTVRLSGPALRQVHERARKLGIRPSEVVRIALERDLGASAKDEPSALELTRKWVGAVRSTQVTSGKHEREELAVWTPDRRD